MTPKLNVIIYIFDMPLDLWKVEIIIAKPSLQRTFVVVA
jgi:hypothetical protein